MDPLNCRSPSDLMKKNEEQKYLWTMKGNWLRFKYVQQQLFFSPSKMHILRPTRNIFFLKVILKWRSMAERYHKDCTYLTVCY